MPLPGTVNNPGGVNSFDQFGSEPPYGEATQQARLKGGAPLAGQAVAAGPIGAAKQSQRRAVKGRPAPTPGAAPTVAPPSMTPSYPAMLASQWAAIASIPGASPLVQSYAQQAQAAVSG